MPARKITADDARAIMVATLDGIKRARGTTAHHTRAGVVRAILDRWNLILDLSWCRDCTPPRAGSFKIIGSSIKTRKGRSVKVETGVIYMSPASEAGRNNCENSTAPCRQLCLGHNSGQLAIGKDSRNSRIWKTALFYGAPDLFADLLHHEILSLIKRARAGGMVPAFRLDGSTDLGIGAAIARFYPRARWYDYTKNPQRARDAAAGVYGKNYSVTFSFSGSNLPECRAVLRAGGNVAVVYDCNARKKDPIPARTMGRPVIDGNRHDARFKDPAGVVVGLTFKAARKRARFLASGIRQGFIIPTTPDHTMPLPAWARRK